MKLSKAVNNIEWQGKKKENSNMLIMGCHPRAILLYLCHCPWFFRRFSSLLSIMSFWRFPKSVFFIALCSTNEASFLPSSLFFHYFLLLFCVCVCVCSVIKENISHTHTQKAVNILFIFISLQYTFTKAEREREDDDDPFCVCVLLHEKIDCNVKKTL